MIIGMHSSCFVKVIPARGRASLHPPMAATNTSCRASRSHNLTTLVRLKKSQESYRKCESGSSDFPPQKHSTAGNGEISGL